MYKNIIFDFDGTLVDTYRLIKVLYDRLKSDFDLPKLSDEDFSVLRKKSMKQIIKDFKFPWYKIPFFVKKAQQELNSMIDQLKFNSGMQELVQTLHQQDFSLGIVTSNSEKNVKQFLAQYAEMDQIFSFIYASKSLFGKDKTLKKVMKKFHLNPQQTMYIGDEVKDVKVCQKIGLPIIAVDWGMNDKQSLKAAGADFVVSQAEDIFKLVCN